MIKLKLKLLPFHICAVSRESRNLVCVRLRRSNIEYTPIEKDVLSMMQRTDFKNLSKNDVISFVSKLGELRPYR